jgi:DNA polymerase-3 subunit alpha
MSAAFVHLRVHSEYSVVDGLIRIDELATRVASTGMSAVALTDRVNLFGLVKFYEACQEAGVKPLFGADLRLTSTAGGDERGAAEARVLALAMDDAGYRNLIALVSDAHLASGHRGLLDAESVAKRGAGLIILSGGRDGDVARALARGDDADALALARWWAARFPDRYYLEVSRTGRPGEDAWVQQAVRLAQELDLPVVATNDVCFLERDDFEAHETRVCIQEGRALNDPRRVRRFTEEQFLKDPATMAALFADLPEAIENAGYIAHRCSVRMELGTYFLPRFPVPDGTTLEGLLASEARQGLVARMDAMARRQRALDADGAAIYRARLAEELEIIIQMGFAAYFLIVMEFIRWAKQQGIPVGPGRGSGAGSLVAYALGITDIDPIAYDLLFERFLNPERVSMPDFDIDFCMEGRDAVIAHVADLYGHDAVSQIITFGTMAAKAVVRDVARVQGKPYGLADKLSKLIPFEVGMTLTRAVAETAELRQFIAADEDVAEIMDMAYRLEGIVRNVGRHAGGVVIAPSKLTDFVPLFVDEASNGLMTQFDKDDVERAGLVKFDFLGLKTLTIIDWAVSAINAGASDDTKVDITALPLTDTATFELLARADTTAVFQLESRGMKDLIRRLVPDRFEDIVALVALFRPGPLQSGMVDDFIDRKHGRARVEYPHPDLAQALRPSYGVILYQEQVMQIAQVLAGFTLGQADLLRRAMGKKKADEMAQQRERFVAGARARGVDEHNAMQIFDLMEKFAGYGFNKSHSVAYALVSYQTAWLKARYPAEFMAAVLSADMQHTDKIVTLVDEVRRMGIEIEPPNVNLSTFRFSAVANRIHYGLGAIKGIGEGAVESICHERTNGEFRDLNDFCRRLDLRRVNRRAIEALIRAGACDNLGGGDTIDGARAALLAGLDAAIQGAEQLARDEASGIHDLFGGVTAGAIASPRLQGAKPLSRRDRLEGEKETLGLYLTGHPIDDYLGELRSFCPRPVAELRAERGIQRVAGLVVSFRTMRSKKGDTLAFTMLDDRSARIELSIFGDVFEPNKHKIYKDAVIVAEGEVQQDGYTGDLKMRVSQLHTMLEARSRYADCLEISVSAEAAEGLSRRLRHLLEPHRQGGCAVAVRYRGREAQGRIVLGRAWQVAPCDDLLSALRAEFGRDDVSLHYRSVV